MTTEKDKKDFLVNIYFSGDKQGVDILNKFFGFNKRNILFKERSICIVKDEASADYVIRANREKKLWLFKGKLIYSLTYPFKNEPLIRSFYYLSESLHYIRSAIFHWLVEWEYLSQLHNTTTQLVTAEKPCEIKIFKVVDEKNPKNDIQLIPEKGCVSIENLDNIRVVVSNNTENKNFNIRLFYLSNNFETCMLGEEDTSLTAQEDYWLQEGESIPYELNNYVEEFNIEEVFFEFKLVYSTEDIGAFYEMGLETQEFPHKTPSSEFWIPRTMRQRKIPTTSDWNTDKIRVIIKNPTYKPEK
jgi:hypothetical protein